MTPHTEVCGYINIKYCVYWDTKLLHNIYFWGSLHLHALITFRKHLLARVFFLGGKLRS